MRLHLFGNHNRKNEDNGGGCTDCGKKAALQNGSAQAPGRGQPTTEGCPDDSNRQLTDLAREIGVAITTNGQVGLVVSGETSAKVTDVAFQNMVSATRLGRARVVDVADLPGQPGCQASFHKQVGVAMDFQDVSLGTLKITVELAKKLAAGDLHLEHHSDLMVQT